MNDNFFDELNKNNLSNETYENTLNGTEKNINYFFKLAKIIRTICFILSFLIFVIGLVASSENIILFIYFLISSIIFIAIAILSTPFLEWKAYTLKNLYEINKKERK